MNIKKHHPEGDVFLCKDSKYVLTADIMIAIVIWKFKLQAKMNTIKKALVWSLINDVYHESLTEEEKKIEKLMPIPQILFPGMNYYL